MLHITPPLVRLVILHEKSACHLRTLVDTTLIYGDKASTANIGKEKKKKTLPLTENKNTVTCKYSVVLKSMVTEQTLLRHKLN